jgi:release factor glutamine methyltransferase
MVTCRQALKLGCEILIGSGKNEAAAIEASVILCSTINKDRAFIIANTDYEISPQQADKYLSMLELRKQGMPLAYIIGTREFMSLDFDVSPAVLIPRQETEILVETVIDYCNKHIRIYNEAFSEVSGKVLDSRTCTGEHSFEILDVGTGSGCIAVSLAYYIKNCRVTAVDISSDAVCLARINACNAGVSDKVDFICGDLFDPVDGRTFDIIVSNPPYVLSGDIRDLQDEVRNYEPAIALDGGIDGLVFYRRIAADAWRFLNDDGLLAVETGIGQAENVRDLLFEKFKIISSTKKQPLMNNEILSNPQISTSIQSLIIKDLAGISRVVVITGNDAGTY